MLVSIPHRQTTNDDARTDQRSFLVVSIPHRQTTNLACKIPYRHAHTTVSIPHRQTTNVATVLSIKNSIIGFNPSQVDYKPWIFVFSLPPAASFNPSQVDYKPSQIPAPPEFSDEFQSLIGRLQTELPPSEIDPGDVFQSLIGRLQTLSILFKLSENFEFQSLIGRLQTSWQAGVYCWINIVSIPHRQTTNANLPRTMITRLLVSIPHRQTTNILAGKKKLQDIPSFNPSQVDYKPTNPINIVTEITCFNPSQVDYKLSSYCQMSGICMSVSIPHRQTTNDEESRKILIAKGSFNPSQVDYKLWRGEWNSTTTYGFNPSQVDYKHT